MSLALKTDALTRASELHQQVHRSGQHLLGIINDILDLSRWSEQKLNIEQLDFELG
jgi:two-component system sensor histidine kinase/response regulator